MQLFSQLLNSLILAVLLTANYALAGTIMQNDKSQAAKKQESNQTSNNSNSLSEEEQHRKYQENIRKTLEDFKVAVGKLSTKTSKEITAYRTNVAQISKDKMDLYKKLTQESQLYLKNQQRYRKKLSFKVIKEAQLEVERGQSNKENDSKAAAPNLSQDNNFEDIEDIAINKTVLEEYKAYLATVSDSVIDEIVQYRKNIVRLNKEKKNLSTKLSVEAQNFLATEKTFKKKLHAIQIEDFEQHDQEAQALNE
jgi:hypothetical protein